MTWKPASQAPRDGFPIAVAVRITCNCGKGAICVLTSARENGEWIHPPFSHSFEVVEFYELPPPNCFGVKQ